MQIIAEIGQAHEGSLGMAHSYIDALKNTGITTVKFQTHIAHAESSEYETFRIPFSYEDKSRYDYWKRMEFTKEEWIGLKEHCEDVGLEFLSSPFSMEAVELLESLDVKRYKIGSGEITNLLMLDIISRNQKPVILSSGMSTWEELEKSYTFLKHRNVDVSIMQCTTSYPTQPEQWGLNVIQELKERFSCPIGFSDHSGDIYACLAATTLGVSLLEFHVVFDKNMFGPDSQSSLTIDQVSVLTKGVESITKSLKNPVNKSDNSNFKEVKSIFEKSLALKKDMIEGEMILVKHLETKKPKGYGISASDYLNVLGKKMAKNMRKGDFLTVNDIVQ